MLKVGLTGGIGSGKSTVAAGLQAKGILLIDADQIARQIVEPGEVALTEITLSFGPNILTANGSLDRSALKAIIFANTAAKKTLEDILHPRIRQRILDEVNQAQDTPYVVADIPLLVENDYTSHFDRVVVVDCSEAQQIQRVKTRDQLSEETLRNIMQSQASREQRLAAATDIVDNSQGLDALQIEIEKLHRRLLTLV